MKLHSIKVSVVSLALIASTPTYAAITIYNDLASFLTNASYTSLEDFSSTTSTGYSLNDFSGSFTGFTLSNVANGDYSGIVTGSYGGATPPSAFDGQNYYGWADRNGDQAPTTTLSFNNPTTALGFDYFNTDYTDGYSITVNGQTHLYAPTNSSGFFGVIATGGETFTSATIQTAFFGGYVDTAGLDNVRVTAVPPPPPAPTSTTYNVKQTYSGPLVQTETLVDTGLGYSNILYHTTVDFTPTNLEVGDPNLFSSGLMTTTDFLYNVDTGVLSCAGTCEFTETLKNGDTIFGALVSHGASNYVLNDDPSTPYPFSQIEFTGEFMITGGTGMFKNATGYGTYTGVDDYVAMTQTLTSTFFVTAVPVPEPENYALLLMGCGLILVASRIQQSKGKV